MKDVMIVDVRDTFRKEEGGKKDSPTQWSRGSEESIFCKLSSTLLMMGIKSLKWSAKKESVAFGTEYFLSVLFLICMQANQGGVLGANSFEYRERRNPAFDPYRCNLSSRSAELSTPSFASIPGKAWNSECNQRALCQKVW